MLNRLLGKKRWPIGLDIGSDSIKMLQLERTGQVLSVAACGQYHLPKTSDPAERRKHVLAGLCQILKDGAFAGRRVVSSLSSSEVCVKNVRMPALSEKELREAIRWEASERFGFEIGPDQLRWLEAGSVRQGEETREEIILLAVQKQSVEDHLSLLDEAGLVPEHIEAEPIALFRVFEHFLRRRADEQAVSVAADVGRSGTRVTVARGHRIVFIKRIDIGGDRFTEAVARQLNLGFPEAYELRVRMMRESGSGRPREEEEAAASPETRTSVEQALRDATRAEIEELAKEVAICLRYCSVTFRGLRPECVMLTGGEAYDPALVELLGGGLGIPCVVGRPLRGLDVSRMPVVANRRGTLAEWAVCAGLALRHLPLPSGASENDNAERRLSA